MRNKGEIGGVLVAVKRKVQNENKLEGNQAVKCESRNIMNG